MLFKEFHEFSSSVRSLNSFLVLVLKIEGVINIKDL